MDHRARLSALGLWAAVALLLVWVVSITGVTGWGPAANWALLVTAIAVLVLRVAALRARA